MMKEILVPKDRLRVLLSVRKAISGSLGVSVSVEGNVALIEGESISVMDAERIIKAIARGFSPVKSFELADENNTLVIVDLPSERKRLIKVKSRLIGTRGKCRRNIERLTGTHLSVYGKTAGIIGSYGKAEKCRRAIEMLIKGSPHKIVYKFLESDE